MRSVTNIVRLGVAAAPFTATGFASSCRAVPIFRPAMVRDVDTPALQPFRVTQFCGNTNGDRIICQPAAVPAGKRLVIEFVGLYADGGTADPVNWLSVRGGGQSSNSGFAIAPKPTDLVLQPSGGAYQATFNQLVKLYFEPGETVQVSAFFTNTANSGKNLQVNLQGYYVNLH